MLTSVVSYFVFFFSVSLRSVSKIMTKPRNVLTSTFSYFVFSFFSVGLRSVSKIMTKPRYGFLLTSTFSQNCPYPAGYYQLRLMSGSPIALPTNIKQLCAFA